MKLVHEERAEGWYTDPFGRHEARWMSDGEPTKLVRDAGGESFDAPPDEAPSHEAIRIEHAEAARTGDLLRADAAQAGEPHDSRSPFERLSDAFIQTTPPGGGM